MKIYAQIDSNGICIAISQLSGEVNSPFMIKLETYDSSLLGNKYENGVWIEMPKPEPSTDKYTSQDKNDFLEAMMEGVGFNGS